MSKIKVNEIENRTGSTLTLGKSGTTIQMACGATQTGFGKAGAVDWCTTAKTSPFTATSGSGFFVNTTSGGITVTLPATPSAGDIVAIVDYAGTSACNNITIGRNGSNINGSASCLTINKPDSGVTLVYVDGTEGWKNTETSNISDISLVPEFVVATGGTITTSGNFKIHTFNSDSTFSVSTAGNAAGSNTVDYLVVAGGGGGGGNVGGGGGAGGYRFSNGTASGCYSAGPAPLGASAVPVSVQGYPVTVGGGGAGGTTNPERGTSGSNSVFSAITSTGGGGGGTFSAAPGCSTGLTGGSGGGGGSFDCTAAAPNRGQAGAGNTPPVAPPQGNPGGAVGIENMSNSQGIQAVMEPGMFFRFLTVSTLVSGTLFLMWLGEQITQRGIGNGISLIIFTGIVSQLPLALSTTYELGRTGALSTLFIIFLALGANVILVFSAI